MMKLTPPQPEQAPQAPLIKVYLTDDQFKELKSELVKSITTQIATAAIKQELEKATNQAPYLNKTNLAKWSGYSVSTINALIKQGLPVSQVGSIKAISKKAFIKFMEQHEKTAPASNYRDGQNSLERI